MANLMTNETEKSIVVIIASAVIDGFLDLYHKTAFGFRKALCKDIGRQITVINDLSKEKHSIFAAMGKLEIPDSYQLSKIITSPLRENSDIIYLYTEKGE